MSASLSDMHEIDALPNRSVVLDREGDAWQYIEGVWNGPGGMIAGSLRLARKFGPVTVLHRGGQVDSTELDGATLPPHEGVAILTAGEFAASWNNAQPADREKWWAHLGTSLDEARLCMLQNHRGLVEQQRAAFVSSADLSEWAGRMRAFADTWVSRDSNGPKVYSLVTMEGEGADRHEVEHAITVQDLRRAAGIAQRLAHDNIDHAVMVKVDEWADLAGGTFEIIAVDGRVLIDYETIAAMLEAAGMRKS